MEPAWIAAIVSTGALLFNLLYSAIRVSNKMAIMEEKILNLQSNQTKLDKALQILTVIEKQIVRIETKLNIEQQDGSKRYS